MACKGACGGGPSIGDLRHRVSIQSVAQSSDGQGGYTEGWSTDSTVWAKIDPLNGYERMQAQQLASPVTHKVTIRYLSGLTTKHRLLSGSRVFAIKEVINLAEENRFLQLRCVEG